MAREIGNVFVLRALERLESGWPTTTINNENNEGDGDLYNERNLRLIPELHGKGICQIERGNNFYVALTECGKIYSWGTTDTHGVLGRSTYEVLATTDSDNDASGDDNDEEELFKLSRRFAVSESPRSFNIGSSISTGSRKQQQQIRVKSRALITTPTQIPDFSHGERVSMISVGKHHSAALTESGKVYMWGQNVFGKLGLGDYRHRDTPTLLKLLEHVKITQVSCGGNHTACLDSDGNVYLFGWGTFRSDKIAVDSTTGDIVNTYYPSGHFPPSRSAATNATTDAIAAAAVAAAAEEGDGDDSNGGSNRQALAATLTKSVARPRLVTSLCGERITKVKCGGAFSVALTEDGRVFIWGFVERRVLGQGDVDDEDQIHLRSVPRQVHALKGKRIVDVALGTDHTLALDDQGRVYSWGSNEFFQLGRGGDEFTPEEIIIPSNEGARAVHISAGDGVSSIVTSNGDVFVFGNHQFDGTFFPIYLYNTDTGDVTEGYMCRVLRQKSFLSVLAGKKTLILLSDSKGTLRGDLVASLTMEPLLDLCITCQQQSSRGSTMSDQQLRQSKLFVQQCIVAARNPILKQKILEGGGDEKGNSSSSNNNNNNDKATGAFAGTMMMQNINIAAGLDPVQEFIRYLYTDNIRIDKASFRPLWNLANTFQVERLKRILADYYMSEYEARGSFASSLSSSSSVGYGSSSSSNNNNNEHYVNNPFVRKCVPESTLAEDLRANLLNNAFMSDIKFTFSSNDNDSDNPTTTEDHSVVYAHKAVLCSRSKYFRALFLSGMSESEERVIELPPDTRYGPFFSVMEFIYTDSVHLTAETVLEVIVLANLYSLDLLEQICEEFIKNNLINTETARQRQEHMLYYQQQQQQRRRRHDADDDDDDDAYYDEQQQEEEQEDSLDDTEEGSSSATIIDQLIAFAKEHNLGNLLAIVTRQQQQQQQQPPLYKHQKNA